MHLCFFTFAFFAFMASASIIPPVSEMAELHSHCIGIPILFPIDANGVVVVSGFNLSNRFSLKSSTIWVEREIFHLHIGLLVQTLHETSKLLDNGNIVWELSAGKYRVYGLPKFQIEVSNVAIPCRSSISTLSTLPVLRVKTEPGVDNVVDLFDSSNEDVPVQKVDVHVSTPLFPSASYVTPYPSRSMPLTPLVPSTSKPPQIIVQCLCRLVFMPDNKNVLKKIDYDKLKIQEVNHLPLHFDGPSYLSSLHQKSHHIKPRPSCWSCILFLYLCRPSPMQKPEL